MAMAFPAIAQPLVIQDDFEGNGTISTWFGDDCGLDQAFANPFVQGINASATVLKYTDTGGAYANVRFDIEGKFDLTSDASFSLMVYVPSNGLTGNQPNQLSLKLQHGGLAEPWSTQSEIIKPIVLDQWQALTFDFATDPFINLSPDSPDPVSRSDFDRVLIQLNGENNADQVVAYLDEVAFNGSLIDNSSPFTELVWSDEFDTNGAVDDSKWYHQTQLPDGVSWYNNEVQHYTDRLDNAYVDDGFLHIVAKRETFTDQGQTKNFTSARLNSKYAFTYGRVEARAKLPIGAGTWPAIWTLGKNINEPGGYWQPQFGTENWPFCGEIDIMEHWGYNQNYVQSALHTPSSSGNTVNLGGIMATDVANVFHTYAVDWTPQKMNFSLDGEVFYTYAPSPQNSDTWPFDAEQYLLLNVAMTGAIDQGFTESDMVIDYIRVYQEATTAIGETSAQAEVRVFPNPASDRLHLALPQALRGSRVKVYSPLGQVVDLRTDASDQLDLNWSTYPQGIYLVVVETPQGQSLSYKVRKQ
jgi:beta-glucanase (GH16 family)